MDGGGRYVNLVMGNARGAENGFKELFEGVTVDSEEENSTGGFEIEKDGADESV